MSRTLHRSKSISNGSQSRNNTSSSIHNSSTSINNYEKHDIRASAIPEDEESKHDIELIHQAANKSILSYNQRLYESQREVKSNELFPNIGWLHILPGHHLAKHDQKKSSIISTYFKLFINVLDCLEFFTLQKYFIRYPFLDLFFPQSFAPGIKRRKRMRALMILALLGLAVVYGYFQTLRTVSWIPADVTWSSRFLVIARLSGKLITFFSILGLLIMFRALTSYFNEIPWSVNVGWRRLHVDAMIVAMAFAVIHSVSHGLRILNAVSTNWDYESYFLYTGCFLWLLFLSQYMPYFCLRVIEKIKIFEYTSYYFKFWFRRTHLPLFLFFSFFYFCHGSGDISLFTICILWYFCDAQFRLDITDCTIKFTPHRHDYEYCEIIATYTNKMPDEYGYYCQIRCLQLSASYTQIPLEDGHTTVFKIKKSILTDRCLTYMNEMFPREGNSIKLRDKDIKDMGLIISGPFHSMEMTIKHSQTRHIICLVSGSGKSVSDSLILFFQSRPGYWNSLSVVQICGRNKGKLPTENQIRSNVSSYFKHDGVGHNNHNNNNSNGNNSNNNNNNNNNHHDDKNRPHQVKPPPILSAPISKTSDKSASTIPTTPDVMTSDVENPATSTATASLPTTTAPTTATIVTDKSMNNTTTTNNFNNDTNVKKEPSSSSSSSFDNTIQVTSPDHLIERLHEGMEKSQIQDIQIWGDLDDAYVTSKSSRGGGGESPDDAVSVSLVQRLIEINRYHRDESMRPHFIVCSKQWVDKITPYATMEIASRLHIEEFEL